MWFIKLILVISIIYVVIWFMFRKVIPWLLKRWLRNVAKRMNPEYDETEKKQKAKTGEINIDFIPENNQDDISQEKGDYVDFEELK